ncbi:MAG: flagellar biosynthesis protein FliQ [Proteobacteria bacterium]|jgi:flagellar biosynthetic protein FliQ|nr:flagellar biosynthesis protein FliQ [Pseudomonadota bacterium]MBK8960117.1 flagellar biosynthesis protein FliQ [Pseudomonadota bacterium]
MTPETVIALGHDALQLTIILMALLLLPALAVGLLVSLFQAATQINEMTLSFIPKLLATVAVLVLGGSYILGALSDYTVRLFQSIPGLIG